MLENKPIDVEITVLGEGNFNYGYSLLRIAPDQPVRWVSKSGPFVISFGRESPFEKVDYRGVPDRETGLAVTEAAVVRNGNRIGSFKYYVAVCVGEKVYIDAQCPVIVVEGR